MSVEVIGADAVVARFVRGAVASAVVSGVAAAAGAEIVAERARELAPVGDEPPHVRDSIHVEPGASGPVGFASVVAGLPPPDDGEAAALEFGTDDTAAQPFMRPAAEESSEEVAGVVGKIVLEAIE